MEGNEPGGSRAQGQAPGVCKSNTQGEIRVLLMSHTATLGGAEIALARLADFMKASRYQPVVVLGAYGDLEKTLADAGVETHILPLPERVLHTRKDSLGVHSLLRLTDGISTVRYIFRLARFLREQKATLLHTNSLKSDIVGGFAARLAGIPIIWHVRDRIAEDYLPSLVVKGFRQLAKFLPNLILANSKATLDTLYLPTVHLQEGPSRRAFVVHDGIQCPSSPPSSTLNTVSPTIGLVGRISPWKGQHIFLRAAEKIRREFPNARFQIIGSPLFDEQEYNQQIHQLARDLELCESVEFTGFRDDVPELIANMDILVHASTRGEPFGQVVIEGMVAGKPIVATNGGGVPEIVEDGKTGLLVKMESVEEMAEAVCHLLRNPEQARQMGLHGQERVRKHFTVAETARKIEAVYGKFMPRDLEKHPPVSPTAHHLMDPMD